MNVQRELMKLKITIKGNVHGVGYRVKLINMALEYGVDRFAVFNTEIEGKQAVIVLIDAPDEIVEIIKKRIEKEKLEKAVVESISFEEYRYEVPPIERSIQIFQMEHWGKAIPILIDMRDKQDEMLRKQDEMLKKQDETIKVIREESEKTRRELGEKIDLVREELGEKIDSVKEELGVKIDLLRMDLREYMESNLKRYKMK